MDTMYSALGGSKLFTRPNKIIAKEKILFYCFLQILEHYSNFLKAIQE